jgi:hypothetical protein
MCSIVTPTSISKGRSSAPSIPKNWNMTDFSFELLTLTRSLPPYLVWTRLSRKKKADKMVNFPSCLLRRSRADYLRRSAPPVICRWGVVQKNVLQNRTGFARSPLFVATSIASKLASPTLQIKKPPFSGFAAHSLEVPGIQFSNCFMMDLQRLATIGIQATKL